MAEPSWFRVVMLAASEQPAASVLWQVGALGVEIQDSHTWMEDGSILPVPDGGVRLIAFFDDSIDLSALAEHGEVVAAADYNDRSWETAWMAYFKPQALSRRTVVGPPWEEFDAPAGGHAIIIEPGMAFGTGTHETTRLCGHVLDELLEARDGQTVLDVGCGSGILSMEAVLLGASSVTGIDVDPQAVDVARANAEANALADRIDFGVDMPDRRFDLVVANILAHILVSIADDLYARVAPGGTLLVSGITTEQAEQFAGDFVRDDWTVRQQETMGEWVAFVLDQA